MAYFLLSRGGAGNGACDSFSQKDILEWMRRKYQKGDSPTFATKLPTSMMEYWDDKYVLIKGEIVVPTSKQFITEWTVE